MPVLTQIESQIVDILKLNSVNYTVSIFDNYLTVDCNSSNLFEQRG